MKEASLDPNPIAQMEKWMAEAAAAGVAQSNAMCLATVDAAGVPSARMVLLRGLDERGLVFYTNYESRKARDIARHADVCATFWWSDLGRQVRIDGLAEQLSAEESDAYFAGRPRGHRLSAWASEQSRPIESRQLLEERMRSFEARFEGEDVPRPHSWGGYMIRPSRMEFWQARPNRLHDRLEYSREGSSWKLRRLQP